MSPGSWASTARGSLHISVELPGLLAIDSPEYHKKNLPLKDQFIRLSEMKGKHHLDSLRRESEGRSQGRIFTAFEGLGPGIFCKARN